MKKISSMVMIIMLLSVAVLPNYSWTKDVVVMPKATPKNIDKDKKIINHVHHPIIIYQDTI